MKNNNVEENIPYLSGIGERTCIGSFTIKEKLPSLNEVINKNRTNRYAGAKMKHDIENHISLYIQEALAEGILQKYVKPCEVIFLWFEKTKKRDVDNIQSSQKFILDAMKKNNILIDDSQKYIKQTYHRIVNAGCNEVRVILVRDEED